MCFYVPLWIAFGVNFLFYYRASSTLRRFALLSDIGSLSTRGGSSLSEKDANANDNAPSDDMAVNSASLQSASSPQSNRLLKMANHLRWYPLIFVVSWLVNTFVRVVQAIHPQYDNAYLFSLIQVIGNG